MNRKSIALSIRQNVALKPAVLSPCDASKLKDAKRDWMEIWIQPHYREHVRKLSFCAHSMMAIRNSIIKTCLNQTTCLLMMSSSQKTFIFMAWTDTYLFWYVLHCKWSLGLSILRPFLSLHHLGFEIGSQRERSMWRDRENERKRQISLSNTRKDEVSHCP